MKQNKQLRLAVLVHLYYEDGFDQIKEELKNLPNDHTQFLFNISGENLKKDELIQKIAAQFPKAIVTVSPNKGKDIGGKLVLISTCLQMTSAFDFYILLHDKQSPHSSFGQGWRKKLFRIINPYAIDKIISIFEEQEKVGMVSSSEFIINEYNHKSHSFESNNNHILKNLLQHYALSPVSYDFVGGTMFWVRAVIINDFFRKYNPLGIRSTLETGNVLDHDKGTVTHAWERMLSWIVLDKQFTIKGISQADLPVFE